MIDLIGQRFGRLLVISKGGSTKANKTLWVCQCDCKSPLRQIPTGNLRSGVSTSCGCLTRENAAKKATKHGHAKSGISSKTYNTWRGMISRCANKDDPYYGGRGIAVCQRWLVFSNFLEDMGERPDGLEIDRRNNDGNYEPENCRWASDSTNARNSRSNRMILTPSGEMLLCEASEKYNISSSILFERIKKGLSLDEIFRAVRAINSVEERIIQTVDGPMRMVDASKKFGIKISTISWRIHNGWEEIRWLEQPKRRVKK